MARDRAKDLAKRLAEGEDVTIFHPQTRRHVVQQAKKRRNAKLGSVKGRARKLLAATA